MNFLAKLRGKSTASEKMEIFIERPQLNIFLKLYYVLIKNFKLLVRSKLSSLIFILGPLLIIFLVTISFNTSSLFDLNVAVYSDAYSSLSNSIVENLSDIQYHVLRLESEHDCIDAVKSGSFHACLIFPPNMVLDNSANNVIQIYVDNSRINIANLISNQVTTKVSVEASALSTELVQQILVVLDTANLETAQSQSTVDALLESNAGVQAQVSGVSADLGAVDLSYESLDTATIDTEIDSIQADLNVSSSAFSDLRGLIDDVESTYNDLVSTVSAAESQVSTVEAVLPSITNDLQTQGSALETVDGHLDTISTSIATVKITNVQSIVSPVRASIQPISSTSSYLFYILPPILVVVLMFVALLMSATSIILEKTSTAYFRNFITPTNQFLFMVGEFLSNIGVLGFQIVLILAVLYYFFSGLGWETFGLAALSMVIIAAFFVLFGMLLGYLFNTKQTVTLAALSSGMIMLFFSNTILPLETLSSATRKIVSYNPFLLGESVLREVFLFQASFMDVAPQLYLLLGFSVAVLAGAVLARRFSKHQINLP